ncbi:MAG TPA: histidine kinase dimerization/phospho-acceptor domain-containing protein [Terriglobales bacterium]|jgi:signal transduction histidine kinase|nr:histidine kinase dimerization/phospho-acceptor domain-containing protein [Terriglobales bacterium]
MTETTRRTPELTAYLSHELRNALACIQQFGNILIDGLAGELSGEQREYIGIMLENASRIRSVLDGALDGVQDPLGKGTNKIERVFKLET